MTIFDNTEAFGLMDKALQDEMKAWPHGHLFYEGSGDWVPWKPDWGKGAIYRAVPAPLTKPSVDWTILSDKIAGIARDANDSVYAYDRKPDTDGSGWWPALGGLCRRIDGLHPSVTPGTCDWRDSWVPNPRYKP